MSFVQRFINISFSMGQGPTGEGGLTNVKLSGLRTSVKVINAGDGSMSTASIQVYGMPLDLMNQLSKVGYQADSVKRNTVLVEAGDSENGMSTVFQGTINFAWPDMQNAPQVVFRVEANAGQFQAVKPAQVTSFSGDVKIDTIASQFAKYMGMTFENSGVNGTISNPYYSGSARAQMLQLAKAGRFSWIDDNEKTLAIWPLNKARDGGDLVVSPTTGMVGYPIGTPTGIIVKVLFTKPIKFGTTFTLSGSLIEKANGSWRIKRVDYSLESMMPHGEWFVTIDAYQSQPGQEGPRLP